VSRRTVYNMREAGELWFAKLRGRTFVPIAELDRIAARQAGDPVWEPVGEPAKRRPKKRQLHPRLT